MSIGRRRPSVPGLAEPGAHAAQDEAAVGLVHAARLHVVDDLDALLERAVQLVLARRDLLGPAAVEHLHVLAARQAARRAAGVHGHVAGADHDRRARASSGARRR